jgi:hypothetical protein
MRDLILLPKEILIINPGSKLVIVSCPAQKADDNQGSPIYNGANKAPKKSNDVRGPSANIAWIW